MVIKDRYEAIKGTPKKCLVVIEAGMMHVGLDKKNNFIMEHGERVELNLMAKTKSHALLLAMDQVDPKGRMIRVYVGGVEMIMEADFLKA